MCSGHYKVTLPSKDGVSACSPTNVSPCSLSQVNTDSFHLKESIGAPILLPHIIVAWSE